MSKKRKITFHIVTLLPDAFESYLNCSILGRAIKNGLVRIKFYHPKDYARDKHKIVDDRPFAGGAGMVMKAEPIVRAVSAAIKKCGKGKTKIVMLEVAGRQFTNATATTLSKFDHIIVVSGRYEGIDERTTKMIRDEARGKKNVSITAISIGPYIVMGGELPALVMVDSISRHIPNVLGKVSSIEEVRFKEITKSLGIKLSEVQTPSLPSYTRPEIIKYKGKEYKVPKVLVEGHHKKIAEWKAKNMKLIK